MRLTREFNFESAHNLEWHKGKCHDVHGHSYKLFITIKGELNENDVVIDFANFKKIINEKIVDKLDHKYLNDISYFKKNNPTSEVIAHFIHESLSSRIKNKRIKVSVWETSSSSASFEK